MYICSALNDRFLIQMNRSCRQLSCIVAVYSEVRGTHGRKSGPVTGLVREARPGGSCVWGLQKQRKSSFARK